jgi:hypothetical protein
LSVVYVLAFVHCIDVLYSRKSLSQLHHERRSRKPALSIAKVDLRCAGCPGLDFETRPIFVPRANPI